MMDGQTQIKLRINSASSWFSLYGCDEMHGQRNIRYRSECTKFVRDSVHPCTVWRAKLAWEIGRGMWASQASPSHPTTGTTLRHPPYQKATPASLKERS